MTIDWQSTLSAQPRGTAFLRTLSGAPPRVLLLEGGTAGARCELAFFWAALLRCPEKEAPCGICRFCMQVRDNACRDIFFLDGEQGNIAVETVREVRAVLGDAPAGPGPRVVILGEAQALSPAAANALLKSLEEPLPGNMFVLSAPTRETLLPTLVSRSFVLTLAWPRNLTNPPEIQDWLLLFDEFVRTGRGALLEQSGKKGALTPFLADACLRGVERALLQAGYGERTAPLAKTLGTLDILHLRQAGVLLENAHAALEYNANAALVLEWTAIRLRGIFAQHAGRN